MKYKISVIIPAYNAEKYITRTLNSIISQTYKELEILVINDGSTDNTQRIVEDIIKQDTRIKLFNKENGGVSSARNLGIEMAQGDYISFVDSDDYIESNMYESLIFTITSQKVDVVRCNYKKLSEDGTFLFAGNLAEFSGRRLMGDEIKEKCVPLLFKNMIEAYTPLLIITSDIVKRIPRFDTSIHMMEDLLYYLELFCNSESIYFLDDKLYHYYENMNSSSKSRNNIIRNLNNTLDVVDLIKDKLTKYDLLKESTQKDINYIYSTMVVKYILRTFLADDEFRLPYVEFCRVCTKPSIIELIQDVDFSIANEWIQCGGNLLKNKKYLDLYNYGLRLFKEGIKI